MAGDGEERGRENPLNHGSCGAEGESHLKGSRWRPDEGGQRMKITERKEEERTARWREGRRVRRRW